MDAHKTMEEERKTPICSPTRVQDILKPLLLSMKLFGAYHDVHDDASVNPSNETSIHANSKRKKSKWFLLTRVYSFIILILMWANLIRYAMALLPVDQGITGRISVLVWYSLIALGDLVLFIACEKMSHLRTFYKDWNELYQGACCVSEECKDRGLSRAVLVGTVVGWIWISMTVGSILCIDFGTGTEYLDLLMRPFPTTTLSHVMILLVNLIASGLYVCPIIFIVVISYVVKSSFDKLSLVMEKHIRQEGKNIPLYLDRLRRIHFRLCKLVFVLDRTVRLLVAVEYMLNIPLACFIMYQIVNFKLELMAVVVNIFWLSLNLTIIAVITLSCALAHDAAYSPLEYIFEIQHTDVTPEKSLQVTLFLGQLNGTSVGFTMVGMIVLTKEVLLTIAGLYVTYFFLLFQFRI